MSRRRRRARFVTNRRRALLCGTLNEWGLHTADRWRKRAKQAARAHMLSNASGVLARLVRCAFAKWSLVRHTYTLMYPFPARTRHWVPPRGMAKASSRVSPLTGPGQSLIVQNIAHVHVARDESMVYKLAHAPQGPRDLAKVRLIVCSCWPGCAACRLAFAWAKLGWTLGA